MFAGVNAFTAEMAVAFNQFVINYVFNGRTWRFLLAHSAGSAFFLIDADLQERKMFKHPGCKPHGADEITERLEQNYAC